MVLVGLNHIWSLALDIIYSLSPLSVQLEMFQVELDLWEIVNSLFIRKSPEILRNMENLGWEQSKLGLLIITGKGKLRHPLSLSACLRGSHFSCLSSLS